MKDRDGEKGRREKRVAENRGRGESEKESDRKKERGMEKMREIGRKSERE